MERLFKSYKSLIGVLAIAVVLIGSCTKENFTLTTTDDVNITGYLEKYPEQFSLLSKILERSGTEGYLGAYGTYTLFAPDNNAITTWLTENGKNAVEDVDVEILKDFVKYHLITDTVSTKRFTDGKIGTLTLFGQYLYTDVLTGSGYRINKSANVTKSNILCGNGFIQAIDKVLVPPAKNLAEELDSRTEYSFFTKALKATGFYDTLVYHRGDVLANPVRRFQTVIAESDAVIKAAYKVDNYDDWIAKISKTGNYKNHNDSLWLYVAYHLSAQANYLGDIAKLSTIYTYAPSEIITSKVVGSRILLNDDTYNGIYEPGAELNRPNSDVSATNGVIHDSKTSFKIKVRVQIPVYWEITDQPELRAAIGSAYQKPVSVFTKTEIIVNGASITSAMTFSRVVNGTQSVNYSNAVSGSATRQYSHNDYLNVSASLTSTARQQWFTVKTPLLVKGKYKVWICYTTGNTTSNLWQVTYNPGTSTEQVLPNLLDLRLGTTASGVAKTDVGLPTADNLMLAQGYKRYMPNTSETNAEGIKGTRPVSGTNSDLAVGRLVGTIDVQTTDRQIIKFTVLGGGSAAEINWFDMIHFIPADQVEQIYPRFHPDGYIFNRP